MKLANFPNNGLDASSPKGTSVLETVVQLGKLSWGINASIGPDGLSAIDKED